MTGCRRVLKLALLGAIVPLPTLMGAEPRFRIGPPDATGLIPYYIGDGVDGSRFRPGDRDLALWALEEWARRADGALRFAPAGDEASALLRFSWLPWAEDAALGRMEPAVVGTRAGASISVRPDEDRFRPSIRRRVREDPLMRDVVLYFVCLHEIGHALGLSHSTNPRDVMWPGNNGVTLPIYERYRHRLRTRDDIPRVSWLSPDDVARFNSIWAGAGGTARSSSRGAPVRP